MKARAVLLGCILALNMSAVGCDTGSDGIGTGDGGTGDSGNACSSATPNGSPMCPAESCYTCEDQRVHQGCFGTCEARECWKCAEGRWERLWVDCDPSCT